MKRLGPATTVLALAALLPSSAGALRLSDASGLHVRTTRQLDSRLFAAALSTRALPGPANVRILLPTGYATHPRRRYPVLYLLHGTSGGAGDWTIRGEAERTTAGKPLIVVMPDIALADSGGGWCTDWYNNGAYGQPEWETFHIGQLIPWVDRNLRTVATRGARAIAGLSQGGFCSMSYAARHPDLFGVALSYSGAPDTAYDLVAQTLVTPIINATESFLDGAPVNSMFGLRVSEEINWAGHDPATLAPNLRATRLYMFTGNGTPGPLDGGSVNVAAGVIEGGVHELTTLFHDRLQSLGIPSFIEDYGPGTHTWPYWARDLRQSIDRLVSNFAHPAPQPSRFTYMSADASYSVFGWRVVTHRAVREFSTLAGAGISGFTLEGSGNATVTTPAVYRRGARYTIVVGGRRMIRRAGTDRRLKIDVPLGPSDTVQEYPLDGPPIGTTVYTTRVAITR